MVLMGIVQEIPKQIYNLSKINFMKLSMVKEMKLLLN
jgi:hypothetical protein